MASGNTLVSFEPAQATLPSSNYPQWDERNAHRVLDFDASTEETAYFEGILPRHYAGGGLTVYLHWMATSATTGGVTWGVSVERHQEDAFDLDADGFASEKTGNEAPASAAGEVQITSIAFSDGAEIDSLAIGEHFRLRVARKVSDGSDTMTGDAELIGIEIKET